MQPTPLPRQPPDPRWRSSYDLLLNLEAQHLNDDRSKLVAVRLLGHLMHEIGTNDSESDAVDTLHRAIIPGGGDEVIALGKGYLRSFVSLFRRSSRTPAPSEHASRDHETSSTNELRPGTFDHYTAKRHALIRDEHQCCVCSAYDKASAKVSPEVGKKAEERFATAGQTVVTTDAVHIVPERLNGGIATLAEFQGDEEEREVISSSLLVTEGFVPSSETKAHQSSSVYAVLRAFGTATILEELNGQAIHRLENILTLCIQHHQDFNDLDLWLEHTGAPNEYRIQVSVERLRPKGSTSKPVQTVMLRGDNDKPPPSVGYLALHAACCKVAHKSGAAQYLNEIDDNFDDAAMDARYVSSSAVCDALIQSLEVMPCW